MRFIDIGKDISTFIDPIEVEAISGQFKEGGYHEPTQEYCIIYFRSGNSIQCTRYSALEIKKMIDEFEDQLPIGEFEAVKLFNGTTHHNMGF
jgi:hypothetical protein